MSPLEGVITAQGLLNSVYLVKGTVAKRPSPAIDFEEYTPWAAIKMPQQRRFMWRSSSNMEWQSFDMSQIDWSTVGPSDPVFTLGIKQDEVIIHDRTKEFEKFRDRSATNFAVPVADPEVEPLLRMQVGASGEDDSDQSQSPTLVLRDDASADDDNGEWPRYYVPPAPRTTRLRLRSTSNGYTDIHARRREARLPPDELRDVREYLRITAAAQRVRAYVDELQQDGRDIIQ